MARLKITRRCRPPRERFWENVDKTPGFGPNGDCWIWTAGCNPQGYGWFYWEGKHRLAHRASLAMASRPVPEGLLACHTCDNPPCVRPSHLFIGTYRDNNLDALRKGRKEAIKPMVGKENPRAKLSEHDVLKMREMRKAGHTYQSIANAFGVTYSPTYDAITGKHWKHLPFPE